MRSMTGYGAYSAENSRWQCEVTIHSVNHKRYDLHLTMPSFLREEEPDIRAQFAQNVLRGNVTASIIFRPTAQSSGSICVNESLLHNILETAEKFVDHSENLKFTDVLAAMQLPNVLTESPPEITEEDKTLLYSVLAKSLKNFKEATEKEGRYLQEELQLRLGHFEEAYRSLKLAAPRVEMQCEQKLRDKMNSFFPNQEYDEKRLLEELVYYLNRVSIDEELVRLESHLKKIHELFEEPGAIGKNCDFYFQEMNREVNTSGSKVNDAEASVAVVTMKTILDQMREQIQNVV